MVAAAGNNGSTEKVRYPARNKHVMCIHAATAEGNMYNGNPTSKANAHNIALLGVAVKGFTPAGHPEGIVRRSGTSQATAVAAGVAALIIQIMRESEAELGWPSQKYESVWSQLKTLDGMLKVFEKMAETRNEYQVVLPWLLIEGLNGMESRSAARHICVEIMRMMDPYLEDS
jgi:subtilisin family serine protease